MISENGMKNKKFGYLAVDLVNDFVTGKFGSKGAEEVAIRTSEALKKLHIDKFFAMDTHIKNDPEFSIWGEHCLAGTEGSELYPLLSGINAYRVRKRHYDSFFETDLDGLLRSLGITDIIVSGISTDICVLHTVSGAFHRYYRTYVVKDLCYSIDKNSGNAALSNMKRLYGTVILDSKDIATVISQI
ncbi:MAG: cysteine hydrolase family protein [Thermoplasmata archaeon]